MEDYGGNLSCTATFKNLLENNDDTYSFMLYAIVASVMVQGLQQWLNYGNLLFSYHLGPPQTFWTAALSGAEQPERPEREPTWGRRPLSVFDRDFRWKNTVKHIVEI